MSHPVVQATLTEVLGVSVCKDARIAIRKGNRVAYAQWGGRGSVSHRSLAQHVFPGTNVPKPNLNKAVRLASTFPPWPCTADYLGMEPTDVTD